MEIKVRLEPAESGNAPGQAVVWTVGDDGETVETCYVAPGMEASLSLPPGAIPSPFVTTEIGGEPLNPLDREGQAGQEEAAAEPDDAEPEDEAASSSAGRTRSSLAGGGEAEPTS